MAAWRARDPLPDGLAPELGLRPGERVLAVGRDPEGRYVVATDHDLLLQRRPPEWSRVGWDTVDRGSLVDGVLTLVLVADHRAATTLRIPLASSGRVPEVMRDRVSASIVVNRHVPLAGRRGVRVTARRRPDIPGLVWSWVADQGVDADDPEVRRAAAAALDDVRLDAGL